MSISDWINKIFGINSSQTNIDIPSEFQLPTGNIDAKPNNPGHGNNFIGNIDAKPNNPGHDNNFFGNIDAKPNNPGHDNNFFDFFETTDPFEESMHIFHSRLEDMLRQFQFEFPDNDEMFELEFPTNNENYNNFNINQADKSSQTPKKGEYSVIPQRNFDARNYFLKPSPSSRTVDRNPIQVIMSPGLHFGQSVSRSYVTGNWNGRTIEKEVCTKQLQGGITEKVIVLKDGNQKCITTITEDSKTGEQNYNKQLINLDESQLNEFENRFSKFR